MPMDRNDFQDYEYEDNGVKIKINLSPLYNTFYAAQEWLDNRINDDMEQYIPIRTGLLRSTIKDSNYARAGTGELVAYKKPLPNYPNDLYYGYNNRGQKIHFRCPTATERWFTTAKMNHQYEWVNGLREQLMKGGV